MQIQKEIAVQRRYIHNIYNLIAQILKSIRENKVFIAMMVHNFSKQGLQNLNRMISKY